LFCKITQIFSQLKKTLAFLFACTQRGRGMGVTVSFQAQNQFFVCARGGGWAKDAQLANWYFSNSNPVTLKIGTRPTNLLAISALGRQTCRLSQRKF
jgi:hypothetical protein